jgi:two-component sensor histidine kinase/sensor domain CHASE-containing protein
MRRRIFLVIGGALLVMLIIISFSSRALLMDSYARLERQYIARDVDRILGDIGGSAVVLGRTVEDYAAWTEMYQFVQHPTRAFSDSNFAEEGAANLHIDVVLVLDNTGKLVFGRHFGSGPVRAELDAALLRWVTEHPHGLRISDRAGSSEGLVSLPQGLLLAAARPIQDDSRTQPVKGTLVMSRLFDANAVQQLGRRLLVSMEVFPLGAATVPDSVERARQRLDPQSERFLDTSRPQMASMYAVLHDVEGVPVAMLQVDTPRDIQQQGQRTLRFLFIWLVVIGVAFSAVVMLTTELTVLSRLMHLGRSLLAIGTSGDPTKRIRISGKDQIAYIGAAIDGMLDAQAKATEELRAIERRNEAFLDAVPDAIFRVTRDGTILDARSPRRLPLLEASNDLVGKDQEMILPLYSFLSPDLFDKSLTATEAALDTGEPQRMTFHVDTESGRRWFEERFVASSDKEVMVLVREVTDLRQAEEARRKEILLKEIHHRVKNNLQVISSLLALQAGSTEDAVTRGLLYERRNRVHSMALIHEKLYQSTDERGISFSGYVRDLAAHLRHSYAGNSESVTMDIDVPEITLDMDVLVPCGLIINELLSNALKYAFPGGRAGRILVQMRREPAGVLVLTVRDDGIGLPEPVDVASPRTLGLRIVNSLVTQLHGSLAAGRGPGASFTVTFPQA